MRLFASIGALVLLDQWSKSLILRHLLYGDRIEMVPGLFNICHVRNTGAAWGMLSGWGILLIIFAIVMLWMIIRRREEMFEGRWGTLSLVLLCAGIVGNLMDRIRLGYVVDFLDFYHRNWHFPAFNVADSAICIGVGIYILSKLLHPAREQSR